MPRQNDSGNSEDKYSVRSLAIKSSIPLYSHNDIKFLANSDHHTDVDFITFNTIRPNPKKIDRTAKKRRFELLSLLPKLRGCYPTKWAIIEEKFTGVTLHSIDLGIDTGADIRLKYGFQVVRRLINLYTEN